MPDLDPVELELFNNRLIAVAEEMGVVLQQSGFSPNIRERKDFSCAVFDRDGGMVSHAAHIPVHLGSTPLAVRAAIDSLPMLRGDVVILNDPYAGGTHLPDVTLVAPVYLPRGQRPYAYVADRAHHADIGGSSPGSMPLANEIFQEGLRIPPVHLCRRGRFVDATVTLFLANTRVREERLGDLDAQVAALRTGMARIEELTRRFGAARLAEAMRALQAYSSQKVRSSLNAIPPGRWEADDYLDDDGFGSGPIRIAVAIERRGDRLSVDFAGSAAQVDGPLNANLAVTTSAVFYVIACVAGADIPANRGLLEPVEIHAPLGSIVNCRFPASVAGGNVETSQRIVDVLLKALSPALPDRIPAASCGTMSNLTLGGMDTFRSRPFAYYETLGGGAGAGPAAAGACAVHTHMTNTLNTPIEALEAYFPLRVRHYRVRQGSGGRGRHRGGDGIDREVEVLVDAQLTLLGERRDRGAYGLGGGAAGKPGRDFVYTAGSYRRLPAKTSLRLRPGDRVRIQSPGGGAWGKASRRDQ